MNLKEFRDNLCELIPSGKVYHFIVPTDVKEAYIVWNETGIEYTFYDNVCCERTYIAKVSYRTRTEYDDLPKKIEEMFDKEQIYFSSCKIQFDLDTGIIYYTWEVRWIG